MNAKLLVVMGKTTKREASLHLPAVLGRSRSADITVAHPLISRRHCEFYENDGCIMLRDLASLNGTMIGGRRVVLAPLLPNAEFEIGPLTFRVIYEFEGDPTSLPEASFVDDAEGAAEAGRSDPAIARTEESPQFEEALPAEPSPTSSSDDLALPDLMALADADSQEIFAAAPVPPAIAAPMVPNDSLWPPIADDRLPTVPLTDALDEPLEVDSDLQSGFPVRESPWSAEPQLMEELRTPPEEGIDEAPPVVVESPSDVLSEATASKPPVHEKPHTATQPKNPLYGDEMDPEFGNFLEGLQ